MVKSDRKALEVVRTDPKMGEFAVARQRTPVVSSSVRRLRVGRLR
jgi:hypothetical protein